MTGNPSLVGVLRVNVPDGSSLQLVAGREGIGNGPVQIKSWVSGGEGSPVTPDPVIEDYDNGQRLDIERDISAFLPIQSPGVLVSAIDRESQAIRFAVVRIETEPNTSAEIAIATELLPISAPEMTAIEEADDPVAAALEYFLILTQPKLSGKSGFRKHNSNGQQIETHNGVLRDEYWLEFLKHDDDETIEEFWTFRYAHANPRQPPKWLSSPQPQGSKFDLIDFRTLNPPLKNYLLDDPFVAGPCGVSLPTETVWMFVVVKLRLRDQSIKYSQYRSSVGFKATAGNKANWGYLSQAPLANADRPSTSVCEF